VIAGMVVDGASSQSGAGLFIHRKTRRIMVIVTSCAVVNILLNIVLVPRVGIVGAAIATLVSYALSALLYAVAGRNLLTVKLPWRTLLRAGAASAVMYLAVAFVLPGHRLLTVAVRAPLGACVYALTLVLIDSDARALARQMLARLGRGRVAEPSGEV
jgi:O-antigen/teichoic acid export membrane protein